MAVNLYELLKVRWDAPDIDVRTAIDEAELNGTIDQQMLNAARQVLLNPDMRKKYNDRLAAQFDKDPQAAHNIEPSVKIQQPSREVKFCPACGQQLSVDAGFCVKCGVAQVSEVRADKSELPSRMSTSRKIVITIEVIVLALIFFGAFYAIGSKQKSRVSPPEIVAQVGCEHSVKEKLKSPSSAKFSSVPETKVKPTGDGAYVVEGYVDAKNSFGTPVRNKFICRMRVSGESSTTERIMLY